MEGRSSFSMRARVRRTKRANSRLLTSPRRVVAMDPRSQGQSSKPSDGHHPAARARDIKSVVDQLELAPVVIVAATSAVTEVVSYVDQFGTGTLAGLVLVNGIAGRDYDHETLSGLLSYSNSFQLDRRKAADRFVRGLPGSQRPRTTSKEWSRRPCGCRLTPQWR